jgi:mannose-6-phosphate isomerase-like protein (cupin superfamily)
MAFNLNKKTLSNINYRKVIYTNKNIQIVLMHLLKGEKIPLEIHSNTNQFFRVEKGKIKIKTDDGSHILKSDYAYVVPKNTHHQVIAMKDTWLYTIYTGEILHPRNFIQKYP